MMLLLQVLVYILIGMGIGLGICYVLIEGPGWLGRKLKRDESATD